MKLSLAVTGLLTLLVSASCSAITLKLDPQIDLLVLDGRKISGSLLKGADSLELDHGQHQFLFRVEQRRKEQNESVIYYQSVPMIVTFTAVAKTITIRLPALETKRERYHFDRSLNFQLVDEKGNEITSVRDHLPDTTTTDMEKAMLNYNRTHQTASVPRFANSASATPSSVRLTADLDWTTQAEQPSLHRWFHRFDEATRQQLLTLVKMLRTS
ncbi:YccT family protein [Pantoea sp. AS142]|uniref:YccT family protein n=1 Tax=Pantoea sp. AS142 TaxID=3081292 RepID=UPI0030183C60